MNATRCAKCDYVRQSTDTGPAYVCPHCGEFYGLSLEPLLNEQKLPAAHDAPDPAPKAPRTFQPVEFPRQPPEKRPVLSHRTAPTSRPAELQADSTQRVKNNMKVKVCPKCQYDRRPTDTTPDYECPRCGIIYDKYIPREPRTESKEGQRNTRKNLIKVMLPKLPLETKVSVLVALAITISVLFSLTERITNVNFLTAFRFWLMGSYYSSGAHVFAVILAMIPAWFFIYFSQLWKRLQHNTLRTRWLIGFICLYLIAGVGKMSSLTLVTRGPTLISAVGYFLIICGAMGTLALLTVTLISLRDPNLNAHGKRKLLR